MPAPRQLVFSGTTGLSRTSTALRQSASTAVAIPSEVTAEEGDNHIGDLTHDRREGGRLLLPLECYTGGGVNRGNTCGTGSIGVADPRTPAWRDHVRLDPRHITKVMWSEVSPDGSSLWTQEGRDLLRSDAGAVSLVNAAPTGRRLRPVQILHGALPPSGVTGATFHRGRLFVVGGNEVMQIWSIDVRTGRRLLEVERRIAGESEGLAAVAAGGGTLPWSVLAYAPRERPATFGGGRGALLSFAARSR